MTGNHSLRPDREAQELDRLVRMKQHPDRQPRGAVTVQRRDHDDAGTDQDFESDWIDGGYSWLRIKALIPSSRNNANYQERNRRVTATMTQEVIHLTLEV